MYIFGYGSLLWYTDFPYEESVKGKVQGYERRFWQLSPDHRGTPEKPGRTVTIIPSEGGNCWGIAYKVAAENEAATIDYLNHREKAGYTCQKLSFFPDNKSESFEVLTYISAAGENEFHTGHTEEEEIAQNILVCRGPSGTNIEYALRLAHLLRANLPHADDNHVFAVERVLRKLAGENREAKDLIKCIDEKYAKD